MIDIEERLSTSLSGVADRTTTAGDALAKTMARVPLLQRRRRRAAALLVVAGVVAATVGLVSAQHRTQPAIEAMMPGGFAPLRLDRADGPIGTAQWFEQPIAELAVHDWTIDLRGPQRSAIRVTATGPVPPPEDPLNGLPHTIAGLRSVPVGKFEGPQYQWSESGYSISVDTVNADAATTTDVIARLSITQAGVSLAAPPRNWAIVWQGALGIAVRAFTESTGDLKTGPRLSVSTQEVALDYQVHADALAMEERKVVVRGRDALATRTPADTWTLQWNETATTLADLRGDASYSIDGLIAVANRLQTASADNPVALLAPEFDEVTTHTVMQAMPGDGALVIASGTTRGRTWELRIGHGEQGDVARGGHFVELVIDGVADGSTLGSIPWPAGGATTRGAATAETGLSGLLDDGTIIDGVLVSTPWGGNPIWVLVAPKGHPFTATLTRSPTRLNVIRSQVREFQLQVVQGPATFQ